MTKSKFTRDDIGRLVLDIRELTSEGQVRLQEAWARIVRVTPGWFKVS